MNTSCVSWCELLIEMSADERPVDSMHGSRGGQGRGRERELTGVGAKAFTVKTAAGKEK
jgi:hypothetical protein